MTNKKDNTLVKLIPVLTLEERIQRHDDEINHLFIQLEELEKQKKNESLNRDKIDEHKLDEEINYLRTSLQKVKGIDHTTDTKRKLQLALGDAIRKRDIAIQAAEEKYLDSQQSDIPQRMQQ